MGMSEIAREVRQRNHALAIGALVRLPRTMDDLEEEEQANTAEIDMLCSRRIRTWSALGDAESSQVRGDLRYDQDRIAEALNTVFAAKRQLHLARELMTTVGSRRYW